MVETTHQRNYRVLMVDDEFMILKGLERMIDWEGLGLQLAATASHGEEALAVINQQSIDIIITDINMPRLSGIEFIEQVKNQEHRIEFIFISGYEKFEYVKSGISLGASDYLLKPIDRDELHQALKKVMHRLDIHYQLQTQKVNLKKQKLFEWLRNPLQENVELEAINEAPQVLFITPNDDQLFAEWLKHYQQSPNWLIIQKFDYSIIVIKIQDDALLHGRVIKQIEPLSLLELHHWFQTFRRRIDNLDFYIKKDSEQSFVHYLFEVPTKNNEETIASLIASIYRHLDKNQLVQVGELLTQLERELTYQAVNRDEVLQIMQAFINYQTVEKPLLTEIETVHQVIQQTAELLRVNQAQVKYDRLHPIVQEAIIYINDNLASELTLKHLADHLHMNVMYLGQLIKKDLNQSFSKYLNELRIEKSKQLLIKTQLTIAEVGNEVGYQNQGYFYRMFKQAEGLSPKEYRQHYWDDEQELL